MEVNPKMEVMWVDQCHKPPLKMVTVQKPAIKMVILGMVYGIVLTTLPQHLVGFNTGHS
jgi:hypothetical protein